jgi:hypothetical protein
VERRARDSRHSGESTLARVLIVPGRRYVVRVRRLLLPLLLALAIPTASVAAGQRANADWKVQAGKSFQRAGEYSTSLGRNTYLQDAIEAFGPASGCRVVGKDNHVVATWASRGIWIDAGTYAVMPAGENGCMSPDLIHVSQIRLTDKRWVTSLGLRVGDPTTKLRRLYPKSPYVAASQGWGRNQYYLVWQHGPCIGVCTRFEARYGVDYGRLMAQVKNGRVAAFWLPVFGQGE